MCFDTGRWMKCVGVGKNAKPEKVDFDIEIKSHLLVAELKFEGTT